MGLFSIEILAPAKVLSNYGSAEFVVKWKMADAKKSGWIIQHVKFEADVKKCDETVIRDSKKPFLEYWEGWQVVKGEVYIGFKNAKGTNKHGRDAFQTSDSGSGTKGWAKVTGKVRYIDKYNLTMPPWEQHTIPVV